MIAHAGKWCLPRSCSSSSLRILYSIGVIGSCTQSGCTRTCTVCTMSKLIHYSPIFPFSPPKMIFMVFIDRYATPFGLTSEYAHPAEILFLGFATFIGPALTGPHLITLWLWVVLRVIETVEAHCGYHFPWSPSNFLPLYGG